MLVSYKLLKQYIDFDYYSEELAEKLTMQGIEVEEIREYGAFDKGIIVGKIKEIKKHPKADRLSICIVFEASKELQIVCGAKNMKKDDKVCLASVGSFLPSGLEIKKASIRGVESFGMLCSRSELDLEDNSKGIWILSNKAIIGDSINKYTDNRDYILNASLTANRGDCLSLIGIAREIRAICAKPIKYPSINFDIDNDIEKASIIIEENSLCKRYMSRIIKDISVKESPFWLKEAIIKMGARPINNVVDITNFILFEMGHPLHAFDLDKLNGNKLFVKRAREGETFACLDDKERTLSSSMLVIADSEKTVALAGVMGGSNSAVDHNTTSVLLESAYFNPSSIRNTSKELELSSESSYRFERGVDIDNLARALDRTAFLIKEIAFGKISRLTDVYPCPESERRVSLRISFVNRRLGTLLKRGQIKTFLELLGFIIKENENNKDILFCTVPSFRIDVEREIDIVEEVARVYSYNKIEEKLPCIKLEDRSPSFFENETKLRNILVGLGLSETINYSFLANIPRYEEKSIVKILNPLTKESKFLRTSLLNGILTTISNNVSYNIDSMSIFEVGNVFSMKEGQYIERKKLACALYGFAEHRGLYGKERKFDFFDLRGLIEALFIKLDKNNITFEGSKEAPDFLTPYKRAVIMQGDRELGYIGDCHPTITSSLKLAHPLIFCELDFVLLFEDKYLRKKYKPISRFPSVLRDLAILVDLGLESEQVVDTIKKASASLRKVILLDIYTGEQIPKGKKSLAFALYFQSDKATLSDDFVNREYDYIVFTLGKQYRGQMRAV